MSIDVKTLGITVLKTKMMIRSKNTGRVKIEGCCLQKRCEQ